ncbi:bifunctional (p)ppGpp synthetase/guanosine-3',5'-bis(diphosphate) 3'-pyrophosphohydrolase [soil metagenome]
MAGELQTTPISAEHPAVIDALGRLRDALASSQLGVDADMVFRAADFAIESHDGQARRSGEPYVVHPIEVAIILVGMQLDTETIVASLLHDVVEDAGVQLEELETRYTPRVARLVDGVTKLGRLPWNEVEGETKETREKRAQAESLRKMFLAMVDDIGVVLIKIADRLHNMRTLGSMPRDKQIRIATQTMEIYAPLANRLGIWQFKSELEDLAFEYLQPIDFAKIQKELDKRGPNQDAFVDRAKDSLRAVLESNGVHGEVSGRRKHIYSIHRKMQKKNRALDEIYDVVGLRVIVEEKKDCYAALGVLHTEWRPVPSEFDDYIANPKESSYQSLHTALIGPEGHYIEVQIRTWEMHRIAEYGVAAHWRYKEGSKANTALEAKIAWLRRLMDWRDEVADAEEFVESLKSDVFKDMIYVFTPAGDIHELPAGATPVDFAYRIHTDLGHRCVGAMVNDVHVGLNYKLLNGQVVKIITSASRLGPSRDWLLPDNDFVTTANAREKIRQWFRRRDRDENIKEGRAILDRELKRLGVEPSLEEIAKQFQGYIKVDDFLAAIGYGAISPQAIAHKLNETSVRETIATQDGLRSPQVPLRRKVSGVGDLLTNLAQCCNPVFGDEIIGYVTRGRGLTVHRMNCPNVSHISEPERLISIAWTTTREETFVTPIRIQAFDRVGLLKDVTTLFADEDINILAVQTLTHDDRTVDLLITMEVKDVGQLSHILRRLESVADVYSARRDTSGLATGYSAEQARINVR